MARRGGKAATRRSRQQRRAQRSPAKPTQSAPAQPAQAPEGAETGEDRPAEATGGRVDAFETADAELRATTPPPGTRADARRSAPNRSVRARTSDFNLAGGSSRLSERAASEYHYVGRDLRNIGVLLVVMVVLLAISAVVVNLLGIGA